MTRTMLALAGLLLLFTPVGAQELSRPTLTAESIEGCFSDDHYGIYIEGTKCGWGRMTFARKDTPEPCYVNTVQMTFKLTAMGTQHTFHMRESSAFAAEAPFAWLRTNTAERENDQLAGSVLRPSAEELVVTSFSEGERTVLKLPAIDYALGDLLASSIWIQQRPKVGSEVHYRTLDEDEGNLKTESMRMTALRETVIDGVKTQLFEVILSDQYEGELGPSSHDARGIMLNAELMGMIELRLEPAESAKQIEFSEDLFVSGMAHIDKPLDDPSSVIRLKVKVEGKVANSLRGGPYQTVEDVDGMRVLTVDVTGGVRLPAVEGDAERYLRETPEYPLSHPSVQELVTQAVGDATTPAEKVERLVHFVSDYVEDHYGRDKIDVLSVIRSKEGDCTEHASLFTVLGRAAGVPTRDASGLVYMGDKAFGGHAWNEVLLDGNWVPVDATWDEVTINATHLKTGHDGGKSERYGKLELTLLEVKRRRD